jgi:hypothetical protein
VAIGSLAGGAQSATQPPALLQLAKSPLPEEPELELELDELELVLELELELVVPEELDELVLEEELELEELLVPQLALDTAMLPAFHVALESVE